MPDRLPYVHLEDLPAQPPLALAIGIFDGVHRGHQALLAEAVRFCAANRGEVTPAALTFDPHPATVFAPAEVPPLLGTLTERTDLLRQGGANRIVVAHFDRAFADYTPDRFVQEILIEKLHVAVVVVGDDFHYGRDRAGDVATLRRAGEHGNFAVRVLGPVTVNGVPARSTTIRRLLAAGDPEGASQLLGRSYSLGGTVGRGRQLGRTIGFPTANLESAPGVLIPANGVYAGRVRIGGAVWRAAISVGDNPTVAPPDVTLPRTVEAYLLDGFGSDIYGEPIAIEFVALLRPMEKFDGLDTLIAQMRRDVEETERRIEPSRSAQASAA